MNAIRVLIVDDQKLFANSLRIVLGDRTEADIRVVGTARDGAEAVEATRKLKPDVILMDVHMPVVDGVDATRTIHQEFPHIKIVMLTTFDEDVYVQTAIKNGAVGYLLKDIDVLELVAAIRAVKEGHFLLAPSVGAKLATGAGESAPQTVESNRAERLQAAFSDLSRREAEVLLLVVDSYDNYEIAARLGIGEQTVKNYTSSIYAKLGVRDRIHAVRHVQSQADIHPEIRGERT